jgi:hypothetical protein
MGERKPIEPVSPGERERLRALPGMIILVREPGANAYQGYVEHSWSMGYDPGHTNLFWSGVGRDNIFGITMTLVAERDIAHHVEAIKKSHPDWEVTTWNAHDPELPVILDWEAWIDAQAFDPNTLAGVSNKFKARNIPFTMKE